MAAVTHGVGTPSSVNGESYAAGSFTPAVDDLLVVFVVATATVAAGSVTDDQGGTYTRVDTATKEAGGDTLYCFVRTALVASAVAHVVTFTCTGDAGTGATVQIARVSGLTRTGSSAIRQIAKQSNQAAGTPAPTFASACLTGNPTLTFMASGDSAGLTGPTGWSLRSNNGYNTPTTRAQYESRDSGFTGTTITWGSATTTEFGAFAVELDTSAPGGAGGSSIGLLLSLTHPAAGGTTFPLSVGGAVTPVGVLARETRKPITASISPASTLTRSTTKTFSATITPAGALIKQLGRTLTGAINPTGTLTRMPGKSFSGATTPAGSLVKQDRKALAGATTPSAGLTKQIQRAFAGAITPTGALAVTRVILRSFSGAITPTAALAKQAIKALTGTTAPVGGVQRQPQKRLAGAATPSGTVSAIRTILLNLGGAISPIGALAKRTLKTAAGAITPSSTLNRSTQKRAAGAVTPAGSLRRDTAKTFTASSAPAGGLIRRITKSLAGATGPVGAVARFLSRIFGGSVTPSGSTTAGIISNVTDVDNIQTRTLVTIEVTSKQMSLESSSRADGSEVTSKPTSLESASRSAGPEAD